MRYLYVKINIEIEQILMHIEIPLGDVGELK